MKDGSIGKISENRFARADLEHILLCVDDDMRMEALRQTNYVKSIVTAQGKMDLERKGKQSYQGWMCARLLAFSNGDLQALFDLSLIHILHDISPAGLPFRIVQVHGADLIVTEKLFPHLEEVDTACRERLEIIKKAMMQQECVTEALKAADQMAWVRSMNSIHNRAEEIVLAELVYC